MKNLSIDNLAAIKHIERVAIIGPRPMGLRLAVHWLAAVGAVAGVASTVAIVNDYDSTHSQTHEIVKELPAALVASRPRFSR